MNLGPIQSPVHIYGLERPEVGDLLSDLGQPEYRVDQLWEWLYKHLAVGFSEMTNLPRDLRDALAARATIAPPATVSTLVSQDGETRKDALRLSDGEVIEAVLMRYERRRTACVSTQAGCAVGCVFCATGQMGLVRSLSAAEIVAQAIHFARVARAEGDRLSNVVLMGMGEPLLNYEASLTSVRRLIDPTGFGMGQRRVTLSTVGIVPAIDRLSSEGLEITLAVSLHAATDAVRDHLVPINRRYPLDALFGACHAYAEHTRRRISFEWALIENVNDTPEEAEALAVRLAGLPAHVNLIPLNPVPGFAHRPSSSTRVAAFARQLERHRVPYSVRARRGSDIRAGCGQLVSRHPQRDTAKG